MSAFSEADALEERLGKRVQVMDALELLVYYKNWVKEVHDINLPTTRNQIREKAVFQYLKNTYGPDAGSIIKWVCWKYHAKWKQSDGSLKTIGYFGFQKRFKSWTDAMYIELQEHKQREAVEQAKREMKEVEENSQMFSLEDLCPDK